MTDRRTAVPFDPDYFARQANAGVPMTPVEAFRHAYASNLWAGAASRSGPGSGPDQTGKIRETLPLLWRQLGIRTLLDLPCGDGEWMASVPLDGIEYLGGDLVPELIAANQARTRGADRRYRVLDLTASDLPAADLILCRDCLVHLSFADAIRAIDNIRRAGIEFLLTTTFPDEPANRDIVTGDWRPINLERAPFEFPAPLELLNEGCTEGQGRFGDKSLGLWRVSHLPDLPSRLGRL